MHISVAPEILKLAFFSVTNTLLTAFLIVFMTVAFFLFYSRFIRLHNPSKLQIFFEMVVVGLKNICEEILPHKSDKLFSFVFTFFIYILLSNWFGILPISGPTYQKQEHEVAGGFVHAQIFKSPSTDLSNTLALAVIAVFAVNILGIAFGGVGFLQRYFNFSNPLDFFVGILEFISELGKILSFAFRLFGNIFAGEVLLIVVTRLTYGIGTLPFLAFEIFVGFIQAFVFFMLTSAFLNLALEKH